MFYAKPYIAAGTLAPFRSSERTPASLTRSRTVRWRIGPTEVDRRVAAAIGEHASPGIEWPTRVLTFAADEKLLLGIVGVFWLTSRPGTAKRKASYVASNVIVADALSHVLKHAVAQIRPDRCVLHGPRQGIPFSGKPFDAFPSGHAMLAGTLASSLSRVFPAYRGWFWSVATVLAATRVVLLAHWVSDVAVGLGLGAVLEHLHWRTTAAHFGNHVARKTHQARPR
jgi:membrane-associated phospholipid phosphatase